MDIEQIISQAQRPERTVPLCLRADLQSTWEELEREFLKADQEITDDVLPGGASARSAKLAKQMEDVRREMDASTVIFKLRAVNRKTWQMIVRANPPREDGTGSDGQVDEEAFVTSMIAACCVDPVMTPEQAARFRDEVTDGQWQELANVAWQLNKQMTVIPFSLSASTRLAIAATEE